MGRSACRIWQVCLLVQCSCISLFIFPVFKEQLGAVHQALNPLREHLLLASRGMGPSCIPCWKQSQKVLHVHQSWGGGLTCLWKACMCGR